MLKRLELVGFKSFADKTRFDFAPGITAVVGPNGSGKSNVADAVRWILGEQSARSLRGGEMADVIFNGSSSRKSLGMAEATVTFDNAHRLLAVDADEVQITRRVYRDGTGEYLVNGQMSRLKDVKEIFLGSGAGAGGYTIIAQGRVDELLQASTKDRREIFDEAAGISRFKSKKLETLRKLAAAEQNLTQSKVRLDALDAQLRTLRMQAAKAQKHREYSERLKELRVGLGLREYRELSAALEVEQRALDGLRGEVADTDGRTRALEQQDEALGRQIRATDEALRQQDTKLGDAREEIARLESALKHERDTAAGHEAEWLKAGRQRAELGYRVKALEAEAAAATADAGAAEERVRAEQGRADAAATELAAAAARLDELGRRVTAGQEQQFELVRRAGEASTHAKSSLDQVGRLQGEYTRKRGEIEQASARRATLEQALDGLSRADADLQARLSAARGRLVELNAERDGLRASAEEVQRTLEQLRVRQGDVRGRVEVLEGLERSQEGLGAGVRSVLKLVSGDSRLKIDADGPPGPQSPISAILGLVADLLTVPRDVAPLVELALGDAAQRFVVGDPAQVDAVAAAVGDVAGRVGFIPLVASGGCEPPVSFEPGTGGSRPPLARSLASLVSSDLPSLPEQLLGDVVLAEDLADARRLAAAHPGCRFVTRAGELLEPDGTLTVGPLTAGVGLVSRKSELRDLREQSRSLAARVSAAEVELADLRRRADAANGVLAAVEAEIGVLSGETVGLQQRIATQRGEVSQLTELLDLLGDEVRRLDHEVQKGEAAWVAARLEAEEARRAEEELKAELAALQHELQAAAADRDRRQAADTAARVALSEAAAAQKRAADRRAQLDKELKDRKIEALDRAAVAHTARGRLADSVLDMLRMSAGLAEAYRQKEDRERQAADLAARVEAERAVQKQVRDELGAVRAGWKGKQDEAHARDMAVQGLRARRDAIAARIAEDYAIDLSELASGGRVPPELAAEVVNESESDSDTDSGGSRPPLAGVADISAAHAEVEDLRRKLNRLGSVNMEALEELTRVEAEFNTLNAQHEDLAAARRSLQEVIDTINADSRRLFTDTLAAVRGYFQELFRKLFGGGQADIVLEDDGDVLEGGIEITARPPGKELRSLSLLSGGEKTLTAIALLLAIFRNKPSPFCVLDEVDAALDEANTQRFAGVLREFLDRSQFIVITHKKRTMAAADRLWGVTMQQSGVSRLLPMRFEDWPEDAAAAA
jgi:chromosome segregation protein